MEHSQDCEALAARYRKLLRAVEVGAFAAADVGPDAMYSLAGVCDECIRSLINTTPPAFRAALQKYFAGHVAAAGYMPDADVLLPAGSSPEDRRLLMLRLRPRLLAVHQAITQPGVSTGPHEADG